MCVVNYIFTICTCTKFCLAALLLNWSLTKQSLTLNVLCRLSIFCVLGVFCLSLKLRIWDLKWMKSKSKNNISYWWTEIIVSHSPSRFQDKLLFLFWRDSSYYFYSKVIRKGSNSSCIPIPTLFSYMNEKRSKTELTKFKLRSNFLSCALKKNLPKS